jgi:hypothetical protein
VYRRTPHRPEGAIDFLRLFGVCSAPTTFLAVVFGYTIDGLAALRLAVPLGLLFGLLSALFGWWFAKAAWARHDSH